MLNMVSKAEALLQEQPSWPNVTALQSFSLPLLRYTTRLKFFPKKWFPRFFVLANGCLYYSDGNNGHPDSKKGTLSFIRSSPAPGTRYCVRLTGTLVFAPGFTCRALLKLFLRLLCCRLQHTLRWAGFCVQN